MPDRESIHVWLHDGKQIHHFIDSWCHPLFVYSNPSVIENILRDRRLEPYISSWRLEEWHRWPPTPDKSNVLRLELSDPTKARKVGRMLCQHAPGITEIYNVDVPSARTYLYENHIFPLANVEARKGKHGLEWTLLDKIEETDYELPNLSSVKIVLNPLWKTPIPAFDVPIASIKLETGDQNIIVEEPSEASTLEAFNETLQEIDPDLIFTERGDSYEIPYLRERALHCGIELTAINRASTQLQTNRNLDGYSFLSYGKVYHRNWPIEFCGRIHVDLTNTFIHTASQLDGLIEVARTCRIPLQEAARASIGRAMSSVQFYEAWKRGLLIPWRRKLTAHPKSAWELIVADRGGLVLEPRIGVWEDVCEIDFSSLYPAIMVHYNISGETVRCNCCQDSSLTVPELGFNICTKKTGIVPASIDLLLSKRLRYKELKKAATEQRIRAAYEARDTALKWILVSCLTQESPVLIQRNGETQYVKIGAFINSLVGEKVGIIDCPSSIFVAGLDRNLCARFCKIRKLIKIPNHSEILCITMGDGRRITTTADHPFFLLKDGELKVTPADTLQKGDLVPVAKRIPFSPRQINNINLIKELQRTLDRNELTRWKVSGSILKPLIVANRQRIIELAVREGYKHDTVYFWQNTGLIPLVFFPLLGVPVESYKDLRIGIGRKQRKAGGITSWLPAIMPVNQELGFFLGLYVSDGSATDTYIRLDIGYSEKDLLRKARQVIGSLFQTRVRIYRERKARMYVLQINNFALVQLITRILDLPGSSEKGKLKVPTLIFNSSESVAEGFLEGVVAGDGSVSKKRNFVNIATASLDFANQLGFLAAMLGLGSRISTNRPKQGGSLYTVNFVGLETLKRIAGWRFLKRAHHSILEPKLRKLCKPECSHPIYQLFPVQESGLLTLARMARTVRNPRIDRRLGSCPIRIAQTFDKIRAKKKGRSFESVFAKLYQIFEGDLGFVRIKKVEHLHRNDEYVYCFQLDDNEAPGFFTGQGAVYTHNCFGYLSCAHAKFGTVDAHMAVCAIARNTLLKAVRAVEDGGGNVLHGIVDSLWILKDSATVEDYHRLLQDVKRETKMNIEIEGIYRWIAFLPSRTMQGVPVPTRYFGIFKDGRLKVRGLEARRGDVPAIVRECQRDILSVLSQTQRKDDVPNYIPECVKVLRQYINHVKNGRAAVQELLYTVSLSKNLDEYSVNSRSSVAAKKLAKLGLELKAGQQLAYVVVDAKNVNPEKRVVPAQTAREEVYDADWYAEELVRSAFHILQPFSVTEYQLSQWIYQEPLLVSNRP